MRMQPSSSDHQATIPTACPHASPSCGSHGRAPTHSSRQTALNPCTELVRPSPADHTPHAAPVRREQPHAHHTTRPLARLHVSTPPSRCDTCQCPGLRHRPMRPAAAATTPGCAPPGFCDSVSPRPAPAAPTPHAAASPDAIRPAVLHGHSPHAGHATRPPQPTPPTALPAARHAHHATDVALRRPPHQAGPTPPRPRHTDPTWSGCAPPLSDVPPTSSTSPDASRHPTAAPHTPRPLRACPALSACARLMKTCPRPIIHTPDPQQRAAPHPTSGHPFQCAQTPNGASSRRTDAPRPLFRAPQSVRHATAATDVSRTSPTCSSPSYSPMHASRPPRRRLAPSRRAVAPLDAFQCVPTGTATHRRTLTLDRRAPPTSDMFCFLPTCSTRCLRVPDMCTSSGPSRLHFQHMVMQRGHASLEKWGYMEWNSRYQE